MLRSRGVTTRYSSRLNPLPLPPIQHEELLSRPITWQGCRSGWQHDHCTNCRLNMHHTLASIRWDRRLKGPLKPQHSLDLALSAIYQHGPEEFPDKTDVIRQPEAVGYPSWRLLKNKRYDPNIVPMNIPRYRAKDVRTPEEFGVSRAARLSQGRAQEEDPGVRRNVDRSHPIRYGGETEKRDPFNIKLGISSHHSPQSIHGYGRNSYGAFYTA